MKRVQVGRSVDVSLRDRIAAVLRDRPLNEIEGAVNGVDNIYVGDYVGESAIHLAPLADAVIAELLPKREGRYGWLDGTVSTNPQTGNPINLEIEPGEVTPLSVEDARNVALALLAAVVECESADD